MPEASRAVGGSPAELPQSSGKELRERTRPLTGYAMVRTAIEGLLAARGIAFGAILGAEAFGIWSLFRMSSQYGNTFGLGALRGVEVEVSACGPGHMDEARAIGRAAAGFFIIVFGGLSLLAAAAALLLPNSVAGTVAIGLASAILVERLWLYALSYLRASGDLWTFARYELANSVMSVGFGLILAYAFGLYGAFAGVVLCNVVSLVWLRGRVPLQPLLSWSRVRALMRIGVPLSLSQLLTTALVTVDRLVVGAILGVQALGIYALAVAASGVGTALGVAVRTLVFPDLFRRARTQGAETTVAAHLSGTVTPFAWLLTPVLGLFALVVEPAFVKFLPAFSAAGEPARIFVFAGVAQGLVSLGMLGLIAIDRQIIVPVATSVAVLVNLAGSIAVLSFGMGLTALAATAFLCRLGYAFALLLLASGNVTMRQAARLVLEVMVPVLFCAFIVWLLGDLLSLVHPGEFALAVAIYLGTILPLGYVFWRRL